MDDNNFDTILDSKQRMSASGSSAGATGSNGIAGSKMAAAIGALPHDQLAKMFPTPPDNHTVSEPH